MSGPMIDPTQLSGEQLQYMKQQIEDVRILSSANFLFGLPCETSARQYRCPLSLRRFVFGRANL